MWYGATKVRLGAFVLLGQAGTVYDAGLSPIPGGNTYNFIQDGGLDRVRACLR